MNHKKTSNKKYLYFFLVLFIFLLQNNTAFGITADDIPIPAQITGLDEQVDINLSTKFPKPGEIVRISIEAYGINLDTTPIAWFLDGKATLSGKGQKILEVVAPAAGERINVRVEVIPIYSKTVIKNVVIEPQTVDIIWEARTYTPPFYKGKTLFTAEEKIIFAAVPNTTEADGTLRDPKTFTYKWRQDGEVLGSLSGYGKDSLVYTGTILMKPVETKVEATGPSGISATNYINVGTSLPEVALYENSPIYGILFNKEVSNVFEFGDKEERTLSVFPYYIGAKTRLENNISYKWSINYNAINVPEDQNQMTFRNVDDAEGKSFVNIALENKNNFFQNSETNTFIDFKKPKKILGF